MLEIIIKTSILEKSKIPENLHFLQFFTVKTDFLLLKLLQFVLLTPFNTIAGIIYGMFMICGL